MPLLYVYECKTFSLQANFHLPSYKSIFRFLIIPITIVIIFPRNNYCVLTLDVFSARRARVKQLPLHTLIYKINPSYPLCVYKHILYLLSIILLLYCTKGMVQLWIYYDYTTQRTKHAHYHVYIYGRRWLNRRQIIDVCMYNSRSPMETSVTCIHLLSVIIYHLVFVLILNNSALQGGFNKKKLSAIEKQIKVYLAPFFYLEKSIFFMGKTNLHKFIS